MVNLDWSCIICGARHNSIPNSISRETAECGVCRSTWRTRAVTLGVLNGLAITPTPLIDVPSDWSRCGVGFDDHPSVFSSYPTKWDFVNTRLHRFPELDLLRPTDSAISAFEFAVCSDVMEHVQPPYRRGLEGLLKILKPGGFAVVSVPVSGSDEMLEHFPELKSFKILEDKSLEWTDETGTRHHERDPQFHGGDGLTLEFRIFSAEGMIADLIEAGFESALELVSHPDLGVFDIERPGVFIARKSAAGFV